MTNKTILCADDDRDFLQIEGQFLMHAGYSVIFARDAYQALHMALSQSPNLLLLDIHMPAGEGLSVQERIRNTPALARTPVIYLTGERSDRIKVAARELGAYAVLYKPFDFDQLLTTIRNALAVPDGTVARADQTLQLTGCALGVAPILAEPTLHAGVR